jgi:dTDP-4-amino-4,6-dideoxygalactose transaminase
MFSSNPAQPSPTIPFRARAWVETGRLAAGDKVLVPGNSFIASLLLEQREGSRNIDVESAEAAINECTRVIMPAAE